MPEFGGPDAVQPLETLELWSVSRDGRHENVSYLFDWGDGSAPVWSAELAAGETMSVRHVYAEPGLPAVRVKARDEGGLESEWSPSETVFVRFAGPFVPDVPQGPASGYPDTVLQFTARVAHVRGESLSCQFDWGDVQGAWGAAVPSGAVATDRHAFGERGSFAVRARARDRAGNTSPWSPALAVVIGRRPLEPPRSLRVSGLGGIHVRLQWQVGANDDSVWYDVRFRDVEAGRFVTLDSVQRSNYTHDPAGRTGDYMVAARFGDEESGAADTVTTIPIFTDTVVLFELNVGDSAGYGWDGVTRRGGRRSMLDSTRAGAVACYFTDFTAGSSGPYFYIASPHRGPADPGGVVPQGDWPRTGLYGIWGSVQEPLPEFDSLLYQDVVDLVAPRRDIAVYVSGGYYALLSAHDLDPLESTVRVRSWFQAVRGLRLVCHREE